MMLFFPSSSASSGPGTCRVVGKNPPLFRLTFILVTLCHSRSRTHLLFCFSVVEFKDEEFVKKAIEVMNKHNLNGRPLNIKEVSVCSTPYTPVLWCHALCYSHTSCFSGS